MSMFVYGKPKGTNTGKVITNPKLLSIRFQCSVEFMHILSIARFDTHTNANNKIQQGMLNLPKSMLSAFIFCLLNF